MELVEIYVLCENRTQALAFDFLDSFLANRENVAEDFPFPEYADEPESTFSGERELIGVLEKQTTESYSLYWDCTKDSDVRNAMLFYTEDGGLVAGIAVPGGRNEIWLPRLAEKVKGDYGYSSFESVPPETKSEFIELCNSSDQVRMIAGKLLK